MDQDVTNLDTNFIEFKREIKQSVEGLSEKVNDLEKDLIGKMGQ